MTSKGPIANLWAAYRSHPSAVIGAGLPALMTVLSAWSWMRYRSVQIPGATSLAEQFAPATFGFWLIITMIVLRSHFRQGARLNGAAENVQMGLSQPFLTDADRSRLLIDVRYLATFPMWGGSRASPLFLTGLSARELDDWTIGARVELNAAQQAYRDWRVNALKGLSRDALKKAAAGSLLYAAIGTAASIAAYVGFSGIDSVGAFTAAGVLALPCVGFAGKLIIDAWEAFDKARHAQVTAMYEVIVKGHHL